MRVRVASALLVVLVVVWAGCVDVTPPDQPESELPPAAETQPAFVATGLNHAVWSFDGMEWGAASGVPEGNWLRVRYAYGLDRWCAVGGSIGGGPTSMWSSDGLNWQAGTGLGVTQTYTALTWMGGSVGMFLAVAGGPSSPGATVAYSADCEEWSFGNAPANAHTHDWRDVHWSSQLGAALAVASNNGDFCAMHTTNGVDWVEGPSPDCAWSWWSLDSTRLEGTSTSTGAGRFFALAIDGPDERRVARVQPAGALTGWQLMGGFFDDRWVGSAFGLDDGAKVWLVSDIGAGSNGRFGRIDDPTFGGSISQVTDQPGAHRWQDVAFSLPLGRWVAVGGQFSEIGVVSFKNNTGTMTGWTTKQLDSGVRLNDVVASQADVGDPPPPPPPPLGLCNPLFRTGDCESLATELRLSRVGLFLATGVIVVLFFAKVGAIVGSGPGLVAGMGVGLLTALSLALVPLWMLVFLLVVCSALLLAVLAFGGGR